jgi:acylglycerol lipase
MLSSVLESARLKMGFRFFPYGGWIGLMLLPLLLMACMPRIQRPGEAIHMPRLEASRFITPDGNILPLRVWRPEGEIQSVMIAVHGFNDYSKAFTEVGAYLAQQGVAVYAYDQRGFGATRSWGIWPGDKLLTRDLQDFIAAVRRRHQDRPLYLLGESMGGAVTIAAMAVPDPPPVDRLVLVAPAVWGGKNLNFFYRSLLWLSAHTAPAWRVSGRGLNIRASDNDEALRQLHRDPLVIKKTRMDAVYGLVRLMGRAREAITHLHTPTLVLYGDQDQIIPRKPICRLLAEIPAPHTATFYPDGYHMLLRDQGAQKVWQDLAAWLRASLAEVVRTNASDGCSPLLLEANGNV